MTQKEKMIQSVANVCNISKEEAWEEIKHARQIYEENIAYDSERSYEYLEWALKDLGIETDYTQAFLYEVPYEPVEIDNEEDEDECYDKDRNINNILNTLEHYMDEPKEEQMNKQIFIVQEHCESDPENDGRVAYVYDNRESAVEMARRLNLKYASGVSLDEEGLFVEVCENYDDTYVYFDVESYILESNVDDNDCDYALDKNDPKSDVYVIALYKKDTMEFVGFYGNPITQDKDKATYFNEETAENTSAYLEDNTEYSTEEFHYTDADDAK